MGAAHAWYERVQLSRRTGVCTRGRVRGLTLIEVMVALLVMAVMTAMTWGTLSELGQERQTLMRRTDRLQTLQNALAQWRTDLDHVVTQPSDLGLRSFEFDALGLILAREWPAVDGQPPQIRVVAWALQPESPSSVPQAQSVNTGSKVWTRWVSDPVDSRAQWQAAWAQAARWIRSPLPSDQVRVTPLVPGQSWQLQIFRGNAWSNALSSDDAAAVVRAPDALRLVLDLDESGVVSGALTLDWARHRVGDSL
jgi:general secretion pathway protein J